MEHTLCLPDNNVSNHERNYFSTKEYQKPFKYNYTNNFIKSYNCSSDLLDKAKALCPNNNSTPYPTDITCMVNCFILTSYITPTITIVNTFSDPKKIREKVLSIGSKALYHKMQRCFLIPEMSINFTTKQLQRYI